MCPNSVKWNAECELAFQTLKICLCSSPVLCAPNFSKAFMLQTDTSNRDIGGILSQLDEENIDRPVTCYSLQATTEGGEVLHGGKGMSCNQGCCGGISHLSVGLRVYNTNGPQRSQVVGQLQRHAVTAD